MQIPLTGKSLTHYFGSKSEIARAIIPQLYDALQPASAAYQKWVQRFQAAVPKKPSIAKRVKLYAIQEPDSFRLIFILQSYYALVVKLLAAHHLGGAIDLCAVENGTFFEGHGIHNFIDQNDYGWYLQTNVLLNLIIEQIVQFNLEDAPPDALKVLYHDLFPRKLRHTLGEYYTPDWLAELVLNRLEYHGERRLLDPACGSGTFLALAVQRMQTANPETVLSKVAGIDVNPLACLAARANLLLSLDHPDSDITLPVYCADSILNPPQIGTFDFIAGNPPWVNWETLPPTYREQSKSFWQQYGLFSHNGMDKILGKGKKDLSILLTYACIDTYLCDRGKLGFVITQSTLKSGGAGAGFRKFAISETPLSVLHVDDFSHLKAFPGASTRAIVIVIKKGHTTSYPVPYWAWRKRGRRENLKEDDSLHTIQQKTIRSHFVAEPVAAPDSAWLTGKSAAVQAVRKLLGQSDYRAHAGVYTGGANAVYWLEVLEQTSGGLRVCNITQGAKRRVPRVEAIVEPNFVFPLLRGVDVKRWQAVPTASILVVQDPKTRRGYALEWLQQNYPMTYAYLAQFADVLRSRAAYKRYFNANHAFYSMFDVGTYTFAPVKVVWQGFGAKTMQAAVITTVNAKPIMSNQAMHPFIGLQDENEAHYLAACLNSTPLEYAVISHTQAGGKSFAQPGILKTLRIPQYDKQSSLHQRLAALSQQAHQGQVDNAAIAQATAQLWQLSHVELTAIQDSLLEWR